MKKKYIKSHLLQKIPTNLYLHLRWWDNKLNRKKSFRHMQQLRNSLAENGSSYEPFDRTESIFVHIPKCAGVSITKALYGGLAGGHTNLDTYLLIFEPHNFKRYFKFSFVRNPWDRLVSAYFFLKKGGMNSWDKTFFDTELAQFEDFEEFVCNWLQPDNIYKHHHFKPQSDYLVDRYRQTTVDFIGYIENISEDFEFITNKTNIGAQLGRENEVERQDYRSFYSPKMRKIVGDVYFKDIELLSYSFEGPTKLVRRIDPQLI